jgi:hypothetical protein
MKSLSIAGTIMFMVGGGILTRKFPVRIID